ncbi:ferrous iron transporter B [Mahella australiensis]|uniref:Ferrous iron transport B domain-containing protein n=1 Tax=Mahella australiensis (strain DSM 15567 / CIP 107919 / 50-1 BON) TaxID=697281 RepID=F4A0K8_MAHA5|nr:ferrous iron transporter B [Mahella australiensis]AEE95887.1 Ferrous iron transport B domain-containing protein [Mahella australiensis 50-1 BON]
MSSVLQPEVVKYDETIEKAIEDIIDSLKGEYNISKRSIAVLLLQGDDEIKHMVSRREGDGWQRISDIISEAQKAYNEPLSYIMAMERQKLAWAITDDIVKEDKATDKSINERLSRLTMSPITGIPILLIVLYFGLYQFVGVFGAGVVVDFIEGTIFEQYINPWINGLLIQYVPWPALRDLIGMDYGIVTLGLRYAVAIILPIVGTFFFMFSIIEDSGYLPRIAMLLDRVFKKIGLNGRAVIPMTLGFGCDTMATLVTRTLETTRERVIATLLLALAIPCSAQLGVVLGLLSGHTAALVTWVVVVIGVLLLIGYLAAKVIPGERPAFFMEVPPLRWPSLSNVWMKTYTRMQWYFIEVMPLFILASVIIWLGNLTGLFGLIISWLEPLMHALGLPSEAAEAFLFGFFRRDYGAGGLYDLQKAGLLNGRQLAVAASTLTLFVPCIAQFSIMWKERGAKTTLGMVAFIFPFAFAVGYVLNKILILLGVS